MQLLQFVRGSHPKISQINNKQILFGYIEDGIFYKYEMGCKPQP